MGVLVPEKIILPQRTAGRVIEKLQQSYADPLGPNQKMPKAFSDSAQSSGTNQAPLGLFKFFLRLGAPRR
jgi:hypothetical protein